MSVSESCDVLSLDNVLAALEVRLETEEAIAKLPLTHALEKCLLFAQRENLHELAQFIRQELDGYIGQPPSDRNVQMRYFDYGGQVVKGLDQYSIYPLGTGIRKLELHLKNGLTLMLPKQILSFLSKASGREVDSGHISPVEINYLLENIRVSVSKKLQSIA